MKEDPYKLRAIGLLIAAGFVGGLFVQYKAPGAFAFANHKPEKKKGVGGGNEVILQDDGSEEAAPKGAALNAPPPSAAAEMKRREEMAKKAEEAEKQKAPPPEEVTPQILGRFAAISTIVDNTLEITRPDGEKRYLYFAPRGVVGEFGGARIDARLWTREGDQLCRGQGDDKRECFHLSVRLNDDLRKGSIKTLQDRIRGMSDGAPIGAVEGLAQNARLLRGNIRKLPGYVPLLEGKPGSEWTRDRNASGRSFVGALLLRQRKDEDRAATFFAPNGLLFEVSRATRQAVNLWVGGWRRQGEMICRDLSPEESARAGGRAEECAHARLADGRVEFAEAAPSRRAYLRAPWADEDPEPATPAVVAPAKGEVKLAPPPRAPDAEPSSFTDLR
ncbi:hypothetical protein CCR94_13930 [Rhodoblastus sphagnicola]|uniref:Uncharacterized protein n=1 Tax=Rhodoblastus sphagnicola TaxID=333368 RepID=A0A2S6N558_9HYPH|nr:hypothetical protein [Rhodoblastus sphagnicola]MBB4197131.1 hypothetical protein [Rhodoblastus sphagnicola]PPQ29751.1 hypothetical protein CCR94_13930 [Rhodoblastus sphagnicola]